MGFQDELVAPTWILQHHSTHITNITTLIYNTGVLSDFFYFSACSRKQHN